MPVSLKSYKVLDKHSVVLNFEVVIRKELL